jgi:hypothetical protein
VVRTFEAQLFDADALLEMAFAEFADVDNVIKLRERKRPAIEKEFAEHKARMRQRELALLKTKVQRQPPKRAAATLSLRTARAGAPAYPPWRSRHGGAVHDLSRPLL